MPRRSGTLFMLGLCPWCGFWPIGIQGLSPDQGHSPGIFWLWLAGQSRRLTSGGKAVTWVANLMESS